MKSKFVASKAFICILTVMVLMLVSCGRTSTKAFFGNASEIPAKSAIKTNSLESNSSDLIEAASAPGVYVEEIQGAPAPIQGVETAVAGFMGQTERGTLTPQLITSFSQYEELYGSYIGISYLPYAVRGFFDNGGQKLYVARIVSAQAEAAKRVLTDGKQDVAVVEAISPGQWGNRMSVKISAGAHSTANDPTFRIEVKYYEKVLPVAGKALRSQPVPKLTEGFEDVSLSAASRYSYGSTVNSASCLVRVMPLTKDDSVVPMNDKDIKFLSGGTDGTDIQLEDYLGTPGQNDKPGKGLQALGEIDEITILYAPGAESEAGLNQAMIAQCETIKDRIVIMDAAIGSTEPEQMDSCKSTYRAVYSPWLQILDPVTSRNKLVPPGGFIAGTFAKNDSSRGVHKAPANIAIQGVNGLERAITRNEQDDYLFNHINPIVNFTGRGIMAAGARTSDDAEYKYINIRRYVNFIRESISEGIQWAAFEPGGTALESRIKSCVDNFLYEQWRMGALQGTQPEHAYYSMVYTAQTAQAGESRPVIIVETGLALLKPAEFLIIRQSVE